MEGGVLGSSHLEPLGAAEGVLELGRGTVEGGLADVLGFHAGEELRWTGHNKIITTHLLNYISPICSTHPM